MTLDYSQVFISTRINEHSGVFREDGGIMFCNFCDLSVEWKSKFTVNTYCLSKRYNKRKQEYEINEQKKNKPLFLLLILHLN